MKKIVYVASRTSARFHASNKLIRGFLGPVGNGKTVCCINEMHRLTVLQEPNSEGVRLSKWVIVRNTHDQLETTTLDSFRQWIPHEVCPINLKPMRGNMDYPLKDGTRVKAKFIFLALDRPDDVRKLLGIECTGVFMNEAKELPYAVLKAARERIGRYPSQVDGYIDKGSYKAPRDADGNYQPCTRKAVIMDSNPCDDEHWWFQLAEEGCLRANKTPQAKKAVAEIFDFFHGPSPLIKTPEGDYKPSPKAENIKFLPGGYQYYLDLIGGNTEDHINVMVMGNYGSIKDGKPVYQQYNDRIHCPEKPLGIIEDLPIGLGFDFGLTPSCVIGQMTETGQLRTIAEMTSESMGIRQFARDIVKPFLQRNFYGIEIAFSYGDPAGNNRGEGEGKTAIGILNDEFIDNEDGDTIQPLDMGFTTEPAPTNDPTKRIDAVESFMIKMVDGGQPGYLLSKRCTVLRKGKLGGYHYKRVQVSGEARYMDKPDKNRYSHCFIGETLIKTSTGGKPIKDIRIGDMVITPIGDRKVTHLMGRISNDLVELTLNNGKTITCTSDHPFYTHRGKVLASNLQYTDVLYSVGEKPLWANHLNTKPKNLTESNFMVVFRDISKVIKRIKNISCIDMSGNFIMERFQMIATFIMKMVIDQIIVLKTLSVLAPKNIYQCIPLRGMKQTQFNQKSISIMPEKRHQNGMVQKKELNAIEILEEKVGKIKRKLLLFAHIAGKITKDMPHIPEKDSVLCHVREWQGEQPALMMWKEVVASVMRYLKLTNTEEKKLVLRIVGVKRLVEPTRVYDITVDEAHCFYANGVLVQNCADAEQYMALGFVGGYVTDRNDYYEEDDYNYDEPGIMGY